MYRKLKFFKFQPNKPDGFTLHNLLGHPLSEIAYLLGFVGLSNKIHDKTIPPHEKGTGRG